MNAVLYAIENYYYYYYYYLINIFKKQVVKPVTSTVTKLQTGR